MVDEQAQITPEAELGSFTDEDAERRLAGSMAADLSRGVVKMISRYTGRGPTRARATVNTNVILVVMEDTLTKGEQNLVAAGEGDAVRSMRRTYQDAMRAEATEMVEAVTGRTVISSLSDIDVERNVAVEAFVLEPRPDTGVAATGETVLDGNGNGA